ncbi:adenine specific DNA methyltransferase [Ureaplasma urealyticum serovar 9 str. ATCC 33175]|nr:adenine specific DNA methyltransferase [Ureaplasma urealyticum serovar 9 str. ATCC 33175]
MIKDLDSYLKDIDEMSKSSLNEDQKQLIKKILEKTDPQDLDNVFQLLIQRVKIGFSFDVAPSVHQTQIAILAKNEQLSFMNDAHNLFKNDTNSLIIGENYDVLKNLLVLERERETSGRDAYYDVIYIDPPYNTEASKTDGNNFSEKDDVVASKFVYRDKFSRNGWLNMMNERLKLAKNLLKNDGVIFVSIDDNEQAYLKVLMDEIFGEENFVTNFIWQKKSGGGLNKLIYEGHEYILCYSKNNYNFCLSEKNKKMSGFIKYKDKNNNSFFINSDIIRNNFGKKDNKFEHRNKAYEDLSKEDKEKWNLKLDNKNYILVPFKKEPGKHLVAKIFNDERKTTYSIIKLPFTFVSGIWTKDGNNEVDSLNIDFQNPKPIQLIMHLLDLHSNKNARVLDFFAGFRVIIVIEANSYVNIRSSRLLPKFKTQKINSWCAA